MLTQSVISKESHMRTTDHAGLMQDVNEALGPFRQSNTALMQGFGSLAKAAMAEGAISAKHKELIALSLGVSQHCSACIGFHVKALIALGVTRSELEEALGVCVYMGGGPSLMYAAEALMTFDELS